MIHPPHIYVPPTRTLKSTIIVATITTFHPKHTDVSPHITLSVVWVWVWGIVGRYFREAKWETVKYADRLRNLQAADRKLLS